MTDAVDAILRRQEAAARADDARQARLFPEAPIPDAQDPYEAGTLLGQFVVEGRPRQKGNLGRRPAGQAGSALVDYQVGLKPWLKSVRLAARAAKDAGRLSEPWPVTSGVRLDIVFRFLEPKTNRLASGRLRLGADPNPVTRATPDVDKLARAILDALAKGIAYRDDSQVVDLRARKTFTREPDGPDGPGATITIRKA